MSIPSEGMKSETENHGFMNTSGDDMMNRDNALELLNSKIKDPYLIKHSLATEAIMRSLAEKFGEDVEIWGIAGLLHDLDLEAVGDDFKKHALLSVEWLKDSGLPEEALHAIASHNEETGVERTSLFDYALSAGESVNGLIMPTALIQPDKKLASVKASSVKKRMKEKRFAQKVNRENILLCEKMGLDLLEFIEISLKSLQDIHEDLGL